MKFKIRKNINEGISNKWNYVVEPHKIDMDVYDIVFIDSGKRAYSKRFQSYEDALKFIKKNAKDNNWIAGSKEDFNNNQLTDFGDKIKSAKVNEDTIKQDGKWVNKGKEGTHGEFATKKEADAQRKAMFAQGFKEEVEDKVCVLTKDSDGKTYYHGFMTKEEADKHYPERLEVEIAESLGNYDTVVVVHYYDNKGQKRIKVYKSMESADRDYPDSQKDVYKLHESKISKAKEKKIFAFLDDNSGYADYNQDVEDVAEQFGLSEDEAEDVVWKYHNKDIFESCTDELIEGSLEDEDDFETFKRNHPEFNKNFDREKFGKYFDADGNLIPELKDEFFNSWQDNIEDESLNEGKSLSDKEKNIYISAIEKAEDREDLEDIIHEIFFYDKSLFANLNKLPVDEPLEESKKRLVDIIRNSMDESLNEDAHFDYYAKEVADAGYTEEEIAKVISIADDYESKADHGWITKEQMDEVADKMGLAEMTDKQLKRSWDMYYEILSMEAFRDGEIDNYHKYSDAASAFAEVINREARKRKACGNYDPDEDDTYVPALTKDEMEDGQWYESLTEAKKSEIVDAIRTKQIPKDRQLRFGDEDKGWFITIQNVGAKEHDLKYNSTKEQSSAWGRIWKNGKFVKQFEGPLNVVRDDMIKFFTNKTLKEASYGGAYDIEDDQFFTREDLDEFGQFVQDELNNSSRNYPKNVQYDGCWIDNNKLTCKMNNGDFEEEITLAIDMRRIRQPRDLINRYAPQAVELFNKVFENDFVNESKMIEKNFKTLREMLNKLDMKFMNEETDTYYDLVNLYEAANLTAQQKQDLKNLISKPDTTEKEISAYLLALDPNHKMNEDVDEKPFRLDIFDNTATLERRETTPDDIEDFHTEYFDSEKELYDYLYDNFGLAIDELNNQDFGFGDPIVYRAIVNGRVVYDEHSDYFDNMKADMQAYWDGDDVEGYEEYDDEFETDEKEDWVILCKDKNGVYSYVMAREESKADALRAAKRMAWTKDKDIIDAKPVTAAAGDLLLEFGLNMYAVMYMENGKEMRSDKIYAFNEKEASEIFNKIVGDGKEIISVEDYWKDSRRK